MRNFYAHFRVLADLNKQYRQKVDTSIKKITNISAIYDAMNSLPKAKELLSEIHSIFLLFLSPLQRQRENLQLCKVLKNILLSFIKL